jgi:galactokinase
MADFERRERLLARFGEVYGGGPRTFRAPGRVNLIGEHTDYNDGFVLPVAIDRDMLFAARSRDDRRVRLHSLNFDASSEFSLDEVRRDEAQPWSNYARGVALYLQRELGERAKDLRGMDAVISGNVPVASGLSSSAALEVGTATALLGLAGLEVDGVKKALLCQAAENKFVGVNCGIMDQYISALGRAGHALLIDCRSLAYELVPLSGAGYRVVVADTTVRRGLAGSEYNVRRAQCEEAVKLLGERLGRPIRALRDVTPEELAANADELPEVVRRRALHVVGEDSRTLEAVAVLKAGDLKTFGRLMDESHASLRDLYEVSSPELDTLVAAAQGVEGVLGARMTGAGFGGCAVALVREDAIEEFESRVGREYWAKTNRSALFYVCQVTDGAAEI